MSRALIVVDGKPRPDFRVFVDLLYEPGQDVDTHGDAVPVHSREWTYLYLRAREEDAPEILLTNESADSRLLEVQSESASLAELAAIYLYLYCGESIEANGRFLSEDALQQLHLKYADALERASASIWHQSSSVNPYFGATRT